MHPLDGSRLKLNRAKEHLDALHGEIRAFFGRSPYGVVGEFDPDSSRYTFRVTVFEHPPKAWGTLIGDAVHNLSSALEYVAWELVKLNGHEPTEGRTGFPIFEKRALYDGARGGEWMMDGIASHHREHIETLQPYNRADPAKEPLALLRRLWNVDKHRVLHTTFGGHYGADFQPRAVRDVDAIRSFKVTARGPYIDGAELAHAVVTPSGPHPKVQMDGDAQADVIFGNPSLAGFSVMNTLLKAGQAVTDVLSYFVAEFPLA